MLNYNDDKPNPFDPAALRLDQSFADTVGVKKLLTTVPVRSRTVRTLCGSTPIGV